MLAIVDFSKRLYFSSLKNSWSEIQNLSLWNLFWPILTYLTYLDLFLIYFDLFDLCIPILTYFYLFLPIWHILTYFDLCIHIFTYFTYFTYLTYLTNVDQFWPSTFLKYFDLFLPLWTILTYRTYFDTKLSMFGWAPFAIEDRAKGP